MTEKPNRELWDGSRWVETDYRGIPLEILERYEIDVSWTFHRHSGFLTIPIGDWSFWPVFQWNKSERGVAWLWIILEWSKSVKYNERKDWLWPKEKTDE